MMPSTTANPEQIGAPATLVRTMDGRITFWSPAMALRYGFKQEDALGTKVHELLRTTLRPPLHEIESVLVKEGSWSGGLIHRSADGMPMMTANHWHGHPDGEGQPRLVTELHSDIVPRGTSASDQLADVMNAVAHEFSEPLTAINSYVRALQLGLQRPWPDWASQREAVSKMDGQLARTTEAVRLLRNLAELSRGAAKFHEG